MDEHYNANLDKCQANYNYLTPLSFLHRSAQVYADKTAVIHGEDHLNSLMRVADVWHRALQLMVCAEVQPSLSWLPIYRLI